MPAVTLRAEYAEQFPELCVPWHASVFPNPQLVALNEELATELGLDLEWLHSDKGLAFLTGQSQTSYTATVAQGYAGHQFGQFNPQLGDGRALLLGELDSPRGLVDIHLKGSGPTPFARGGDGYAALGPMLREMLMGEALHACGIPTTRVLAVVRTGHSIERQGLVPGALAVRVAASHVRVGTFQFAAVLRNQQVAERLVQYCLHRHFPERIGEGAAGLLEAVIDAQTSTVAQWLGIGFVHGVMNTDNTTISGETIDYGPCAFIDTHDVNACFSSVDTFRRYRYGSQPAILGWNLARFAEVLLPLIDDDMNTATEKARQLLGTVGERFENHAHALWSKKLGVSGHPEATTIVRLALDYLAASHNVDHTSFFLQLDPLVPPTDPAASELWARWTAANPSRDERAAHNPVFIPRNRAVENALAAADNDDWDQWKELLRAVRHPFDPRYALDSLTTPAPPEWTEHYRTFCGT